MTIAPADLPVPWAIPGCIVYVLHKTDGKGAPRSIERRAIRKVTKTLIILDNDDRFRVATREPALDTHPAPTQVAVFIHRDKGSADYTMLIGPDHSDHSDALPRVNYRLWGIGENGHRVSSSIVTGNPAQVQALLDKRNDEAERRGLPRTWRAEVAQWRPFTPPTPE